MGGDIVEIQTSALALGPALERIGASVDGISPGEDNEAGALVTFSGIVRRSEGAGTVSHLNYEQYEGMALEECRRLVAEARERWPLRRVLLQHRVGAVAVGEPSVLVAVSAGHRAEAFEAARFLIDELKRRVPIWKAAVGG